MLFLKKTREEEITWTSTDDETFELGGSLVGTSVRCPGCSQCRIPFCVDLMCMIWRL